MSESQSLPDAATAEARPCANCGALLHGPFCYACGQPKKGLIRHFGGIVGDFFDTVFSLDSRTFRTLLPLYLRPGFLSNEYFTGRRVRYVTPLRLYFFLSVIAFLVISATTDVAPRDGGEGLQLQFGDAKNEVAAANDPDAVLKRMEAGLKRLPPEQAEALRERVRAQVEMAGKAEQERAEAERIAAAVDEVLDEADPDDDEFTLGGDQPWHPTKNPLVISWLSASLNEALNAEIGALKQKAKRIRRDPGAFVRQIFSVAPQTLFVLLPIFALLLKVFYLFKRRLYMEHLIVALHSHSFIALTILVLITLAQTQSAFAPDPGVLRGTLGFLFVAAWVWLPVYLLIMQKRVYRQNWFATLFKFVLLGSAYLVLLSVGMLGTMLVSWILF